MPKYRYAFNPDDKTVDVLELTKGSPEAQVPFQCAGCGDPVVPHLKDDQKVKHFAHKVRQISCSEETYLHRIAKRTFIETYQACLDDNEPFTIELKHPKICARYKDLLGVRCSVGEHKKFHDLTGYYDGIREEKRDGQFIPDVLIYNGKDSSRKIYVEIAVTHFLSEQKEASGNLIIEIPVENEGALEKIKSRTLTEQDARFVGFSRPASPVTDADCHCARRAFLCFFIFDSGKVFLERAPLSEIVAKNRKFGEKVRYVRILTPNPSPTAVRGLLESASSGGLQIVDPETGEVNDAPPEEEDGKEDTVSYGHPYRPLASNDPGYLFVALLEEARKRGFPVKNCYLCRYKGENWGLDAETGIYCKVLKKMCNSNAAVNCNYFRPPKHPT